VRRKPPVPTFDERRFWGVSQLGALLRVADHTRKRSPTIVCEQATRGVGFTRANIARLVDLSHA
jgi:hypothetical protein